VFKDLAYLITTDVCLFQVQLEAYCCTDSKHTNMTLLWDVIHDFTARSFYMLLKSKYLSRKVFFFFAVLNYAIQQKRDVRSVDISAEKS